MSQSLNIKLRGLYTFPNDFSAIPDGALSLADNIVIDRDSIAEPRRGFTYLGTSDSALAYFNQSTGRALKIFFFKNKVMTHYKTTAGDYYLGYFEPATGWADIAGAFNPPTSTTKVRSCQSNKNQYLTSNNSVYKQETYTSVPTRVGVPEALTILATITTGASQWLAPKYVCSYRLVWGIKDANGNEILGAPCGITTINGDTTATSYVTVVARIPFGITVNHFYRLYRSFQVDNTSGTVSPQDRQYQVYEGKPTSANISTDHTVTIVDLCPEGNFGSDLYTNDTQQGSVMANAFPPMAIDLCTYRDSMFYANIVEQQILFLTYSGGLADGDKITIAALEMTAKTSPSAGTTQFKLFAGSDGFSIRETCNSMLRIFNANMSNSLTGNHGSYISSFTDLAGKMIFKTNVVGGSAFAATAASTAIGALFIPALPASGTTVSSTADTSTNGLAYSKPYQPEHVPTPYRIYVGSKDSAILRIIPLRDSLFILKEDGVWRLYGNDPSNFQVALLDSTANCIAPDAACVMNNMIFALTTQGVVTISETGVTIMSRPIEGDLLKLLAINQSVLYSESFAIPYESQRAYHVWIPTTSSDTYPTQYYRYNTITNNWTRGTLAKRCGGVNPVDDKMYLGNVSFPMLDKEMKSLTSFDYADYSRYIHVASVTGAVVTITATTTFTFVVTTATAAAGDTYTNNGVTFTVVASVTAATSIVCTSTSGNPTSSGNLARATGSGTNPIVFRSWTSDGVVPGQVLYQSDSLWGEIKTVDSSTQVTLKYAVALTHADTQVLDTIKTALKWIPCTFGNPGFNKQVREASLLFLADFYGTGGVTFETDMSATMITETVTGCMAAPWGQFPWGQAPFGMTSIARRRPLRVMVPRIHQRCSLLTIGFDHDCMFSPWALQGISVVGNNISEKVWMEGSTV